MPPSKIMVLSPFSILPPHFGASERTYNLVQGLADYYAVTLLYTDYAQVKVAPTQADIPRVVSYKVGPSQRWAQLFNPLLILKGLQLIRRERPSLLVSAHLWAGINTLILHFLTGVPFILDEHNVESVRWQRMRRTGVGLLTWAEKTCCLKARAVFCVSEADKKLLLQLGISAARVFVLRNAVDLAQYHPDPDSGETARQALGLQADLPMALFFGKLDYQPNAEAVDIIAREIAPRVLALNPAVRFVVCGYRPPVERYADSKITFTGMVPRIEDYINAAQVVIVPLVSGGGTKFKIIQAIACGRPVITTPIGAEGLGDATAWMQVADNWDDFVRAMLQTLASPRIALDAEWRAFCSAYAPSRMAAMAQQVIAGCLADPG